MASSSDFTCNKNTFEERVLLYLKALSGTNEDIKIYQPPGCGFSVICLFWMDSCEVVITVGSHDLKIQ